MKPTSCVDNCTEQADEVLDHCLQTCSRDIAIPGTDWLMAFADRQAAERFGKVERIDQQLYRLPHGKPGGWMVVYRAKGTKHSRKSLLSALAKHPEQDFSSQVFGLHVGAHISQLPCWQRGLALRESTTP